MSIPKKTTGWILLALFLIGRILGAQRAFEGQGLAVPDVQPASYEVKVLEEPQVFLPREAGDHTTGREGERYSPRVTQVRALCLLRSRDGVVLPKAKVRCTFKLTPSLPSPVLSFGDRVVFQGKVLRPRRALNPGQFDYAAYLRNKGVAFTAYPEAGTWRKIPGGSEGPSFRSACASLKRAAEGALCRHLGYPMSALLDGILLGEKSGIPRDMVEDFFLTGTVHILAVSGLMTAFVSGALFFALRWLGLPRKPTAVLSLIGLCVFVCMTGADPPVCRAGLFSGMALGAVLLERRIRGGTLLLATGVILVLFEPLSLFDLSFQISFLATAGLMALAPRLARALSFLGRAFSGMVAATIAAQFSVAWFLAYHFNQASPYGLPANLLVVPLALLSTALGLVLLTASLVHPMLGELMGYPTGWVLRALAAVTSAAADLPGAQGWIASPPGRLTLLFHLLFGAGLLLHWPRPVPEAPSFAWVAREGILRSGRSWVGRSAFLFLILCGTLWAEAYFGPPHLRVTYLAVGHGNAAVLEAPGGRVFVVDGGKGSRGPDRFHPLVAFLRHRGEERVEAVFASHPDDDHIGGLTNLLGACEVGVFYLPKTGGQAPFPERFLEDLGRKGLEPLQLTAGRELDLGAGLRLEVLHPSERFHPRRSADNNLSLVLRFRYGRTTFLFPGDLEREGLLRSAREGEGPGPVDWLLAPHHGRASGEPALSARIFHSRFVVFSDGFDHPASSRAYREGVPGVEVLSTARSGALVVEVGLDGRGRVQSFLKGKNGVSFRFDPPGGNPPGVPSLQGVGGMGICINEKQAL